MAKCGLIVNGQNNSVSRVGGAGRYAEQLYSYLNSSNAKADLAEIEIFLTNFPQNSSGDVRTEGNRVAVVAHANKIAQKWVPPIVLEKIYQIRKSINRKVEQGEPSGRITDSVSDFCKLSAAGNKVVWHELSNYTHSNHLGRACLSSKLFLAVTFLDIQDYYYPEYFSDGILMRRRLSYSFYKERAQVYFAISEFTKSTMVERLCIDPAKIKVIYLAAPDIGRFSDSGNVGSIGNVENTCKCASGYGRYWMYPAKLWKHKNHKLLLRSIGKRKDKFKRNGVKFVLTGGFDENDWSQLKSMIRENAIGDIMVPLGFQTDKHLHALYKSAELMFFPSLFEGFGMPILEAMALGCPVVCSQAGALKEIGGGAAVYFDARSEDSIVSIIDDLLEGRVDLKNLVPKGKENILRFTWEDTCRNTISEYKSFF